LLSFLSEEVLMIFWKGSGRNIPIIANIWWGSYAVSHAAARGELAL
jgi:hypothetical protein